MHKNIVALQGNRCHAKMLNILTPMTPLD